MATYYIDPAGDDGTGDGSIGNPWASLYKATTSVSGTNTIHANAGTYNEAHQCVLASNTSIEGASMSTTTINFTYVNINNWEGCLKVSGGSSTAQSISDITFDGQSLTAQRGVSVYGRSNVDINHITVRNFQMHGVEIGGTGNADNELSFSSIINCGGQPNHTACLRLSNCVRLLVHDNTITQTARATNLNGNCIGGYEALYDCKFYNNVITAAPYLWDYNWKFAIELFHPYGLEIYDNIVQGEVDFGQDTNYGAYDYGVYFHNNICGWDAPLSVSTIGIQFEQTVQGVIVCNNLFKNLDIPIYFCQYKYADDYVEDVWVYSNVLYNCGLSTTSAGWGIRFQSGSNDDAEYPPQYYNNINIWNNTIVAYAAHPGARGIELPSHATSTSNMYIDVRNNIIVGFSVAGITARQQDNDYSPAISYLDIYDNILYGNGNSNNYYWVGFTPTNYNYDTPIKSDPLFKSSPTNLHLDTGSPAIAAGTDVTPPYDLGDYDGLTWGNPPDIGAYEYVDEGEIGINNANLVKFSIL